MGVDLTVLKAEGFLIPLKNLPKDVRKDLEDCSGEEAGPEEDSGSEEVEAEKDEDDSHEDERPTKRRNVDESEKKGVLRFCVQDGPLGSSEGFEPYGLLIPPGNKVKTILDEKVGLTPWSFTASGIYSGSSMVKGGANIPFVIKSYEGEVDPDTTARDVLEQGKLDSSGLSEKILKWLNKEKDVDYGLFLFSYFC